MNTGNLIELSRRLFGLPVEVAAEAVQPVADDTLPASVCRALAEAQVFERPGDDECRPRRVITVPGKAPFIDGEVSTEQALQARFPELSKPQAQAGAEFLRHALRARRRMHQRSRSNWVNSF